MTKSYSSLLSWFGLTLAASLMLYHTSDRVTALDRQLKSIDSQIDQEQQSLHVLKAEWVYLANPARIEAETKRHLDLQVTPPERVVGMNSTAVAELLPLRSGVTPAPQTQVASVDLHSEPAAPTHDKTPTHSGQSRVFSAINSGHINDHVLLQHGAAVQASTDTIGGLINSLSMRQ